MPEKSELDENKPTDIDTSDLVDWENPPTLEDLKQDSP